jgi:hypothetical protein
MVLIVIRDPWSGIRDPKFAQRGSQIGSRTPDTGSRLSPQLGRNREQPIPPSQIDHEADVIPLREFPCNQAVTQATNLVFV